jgi:hypothetical protein
MQDMREVLVEKLFQVYVLSEYGNILFAYSPKLPVLTEQSLRILPISISFTGLKKYCFQHIVIGELTVSVT